ncbi:unnamed protein product [Lepeophtheirus salmonis]|uniref:(salmon louse) hypothetical protein n=1 Tax=Lepeophtheirus salmonis TaxID=72036 RepID=A0A7R8D8K4_LEPSM|nr:unnamed protein product [Lepeophtheirus salmonis]CAF3036056.1 unnamed protein product [Lepeophtheirus salmonis]
MNEYYNDLVLMVFDHEIKEGKKVSGKLSDKEKVKLNNGDASEIRKKEEQLNKMGEEKKNKKEIGILRKKEEKKKLEEIQKLESLREEESKKIQEEFAMRQRLLQEQHAKEIKMLKQREKEVDVLQKHTSSSKEVQTENISTENKIKKLQELYLKKLTQQQIDQSRLAGEQEKTSDMCEVDVEEPNKNITTETYMRNVFSNTDDPRRSILKYRNKGNQTDFSIQKKGATFLHTFLISNVEIEHVGEWIKSMSTSEENRHFKDAMTQTNETRPFNMANAMSESALFNYMASKTHSRRHSDDIYSQPERPNFKNTSLPLPTPSRNNNAEEVTIDRGTPISTLKISAPMYSPLIINVPDVISLSKVVPEMKLKSPYTKYHTNSTLRDSFNKERSISAKTEEQDEQDLDEEDEHELTACANNQHSPNTNDEKTYFIPEQHSRPAPRRISHLKTMDS